MVFRSRWLALGLLAAFNFSSACAGSQQGPFVPNEDPPTDVDVDSSTEEDTTSSDSLFLDVPEGRLRAEAWPETTTDRPWAVLEEGEGTFVTASDEAAPWRFVFSSRESSLPVRGVWIEFPAGMDPALRPTIVELRTSPTPIEISREAWPAVSPLLRSLGVAELPSSAGRGFFIEFDAVERVSLLEIRVLRSVGGRQAGLGRVQLVHQRARDERADLRPVRLQPLNATSSAPEDTGILGIEGASPLPIPSKK